MQNQPDEMKKLMLADEGCYLITADLSQAENRVVAYVADIPRMIEAFEQGRDVHRMTASLIYGKPESEISDVPRSGVGVLSERGVGKHSNHGLNYGLSAEGFALRWELDIKDATTIVNKYHAAYPEIRQWQESIKFSLRNSRTLKNLFSRKVTFAGSLGEQLFLSAYSFIPQSTVADLLNRRGLIYVYEEKSIFKDIELLNQVHDSIVLQVPVSIPPVDVAYTLTKLCDSLEVPICYQSRIFKISVDISIGYNLYDMTKYSSKEVRQLGFYEKIKAFLSGGTNGKKM